MIVKAGILAMVKASADAETAAETDRAKPVQPPRQI
jgi:hypothetical protein